MKIKAILLGLFIMLGLGKVAMAAQTEGFQLSTHVLDISQGTGARDLEVQLFRQVMQNNQASWEMVGSARTDDTGTVSSFLPIEPNKDNFGIYKLVFLVAPYFQANNKATFYPYIDVVFILDDKNHYHVPITLSNFGYSTYRGN